MNNNNNKRDINWLEQIEPGTLLIIKKPVVAINLNEQEIQIDENEIVLFLQCKDKIFDVDLSGLRPVTCMSVLYKQDVYDVVVHSCPPIFNMDSYYFYLQGTIALLTDFDLLDI